MSAPTTKHRLIAWGVAFSALLHGMALYCLSLLPVPRMDSATETATLWVHAWQDPRTNAGTAASPASAFRPWRPRHESVRPTEHARPDARTESALPGPLEIPSPHLTNTAQENEVANHVLGLVLHSVSRYFVYPPFAQRAGWEGEVIVAFQINPDGEIRDVRLVRSSGYALLDEDALLILRRIGSIPDARAWLRGQRYDARVPVIYRLTG